ncbi:hypothetical protein MCETRH20_01331 [Methylophilaceae bacterium]
MNKSLQKAGDECAGIAEQSVANMNALVTFQMLEKEDRKINVMRRCMADRAYMENQKWLAYGAPMLLPALPLPRSTEICTMDSCKRSNSPMSGWAQSWGSGKQQTKCEKFFHDDLVRMIDDDKLGLRLAR